MVAKFRNLFGFSGYERLAGPSKFDTCHWPLALGADEHPHRGPALTARSASRFWRAFHRVLRQLD